MFRERRDTSASGSGLACKMFLHGQGCQRLRFHFGEAVPCTFRVLATLPARVNREALQTNHPANWETGRTGYSGACPLPFRTEDHSVPEFSTGKCLSLSPCGLLVLVMGCAKIDIQPFPGENIARPQPPMMGARASVYIFAGREIFFLFLRVLPVEQKKKKNAVLFRKRKYGSGRKTRTKVIFLWFCLTLSMFL